MTDASTPFNFDMAGIDRNALLQAAAREVDAVVQGHLGTGAQAAPSVVGDEVRSLLEDRATLPAYPQVYKISDQDFIAKSLPVPVSFAEQKKKYRFYWVQFAPSLFPARNWNYTVIELGLEFNRDEARPELRPTAHQVLPDNQFQELTKLGTQLQVGINEKFELDVRTGPVGGALGGAAGKLDAGVGANAGGSLQLAVGPFELKTTRAKIYHDKPSQTVSWRLDGSEFGQEATPDFVVILKVPKALEQVKIAAALQVARSFNFASGGLREAVAALPTVFKDYFTAGMPLRYAVPGGWDITSSL